MLQKSDEHINYLPCFKILRMLSIGLILFQIAPVNKTNKPTKVTFNRLTNQATT